MCCFQIPPIWYGEENNAKDDDEHKQIALLVCAFGFGFVVGVGVYFALFFMCCIKDQIEHESSSHHSQYHYYYDTEDQETLPAKAAKKLVSPSSYSEYYV